jgi:hypothetical protein
MILSPIITNMTQPAEATRQITWDISITGAFDPEGLTHLRDDHPAAIIDALASSGAPAMFCAISELISHRNIEKAAILARAYSSIDPGLDFLLKDKFGEPETLAILTENVLRLAKIIATLKKEPL